MKDHKNSGHWVRNIILAALLAVLCIGGVELAACSQFAPETYDRIMAPVRYAASVVADTGKAALNAAGQFCQAVAAKTAELASQTAQKAAAAAAQAAAAWEDFLSGPEEELPTMPDSPPPEETLSPAAVTDPPLTELLEADGRQVLTGGITDVVYFCQADEEWADQPYGTDPIGPYGCGPTVMAIAVATLTDTDTDPARMAAWAADHGYWAPRSGSYYSIVQGTAQSFGLEAVPVTERTVEELRGQLASGHMIVALMGRGHFTSIGHFILLRGLTPAGDILVADPNSLDNSLQAWDPQLILDELSASRANGAPLWALSVPDT